MNVWAQAPSWANYMTVNPDGSVHWFEVEPEVCCGRWTTKHRFELWQKGPRLVNWTGDWTASLTQRQ